jgi:L-ascorbate metabolism protein UlaG (beta-lactamase superfamily)
MQVEWYGQSAFRLSTGTATVFIDPFGDMSNLVAGRRLQFDYPPITPTEADLVLITHEHVDHNAVDALGGSPAVIRSTAGRLESPIGEIVAVASEHDAAAGTERGPNTIFVFDFDGVRVCHLGDFGQAAMRDEQAAAIGTVELLLIPVGGGPTIGAEQAAAITERLGARWVVPMHYRTHRVNFLEPADEFLTRIGTTHELAAPRFDTSELPGGNGPVAVLPAAP